MKRKYTTTELWAFINRADTHERIEIAKVFITKLGYLGNDTWNEMMEALAFKSRELYKNEPDDFLDRYNRNEDEYERHLMRMRVWNL